MNTATVAADRFVEVAPDAQFEDRRATLTYKIPDSLRGQLAVGQLIWVPLRRQLVLGIVSRTHDNEPQGDFSIRDVYAPVEPTFQLSSIQWQLAVWIAEQTVSTLYEAASMMLPPGVSARAVEHLELLRSPDEDEREKLTKLQARLIERLEANQSMTLAAARSALNSKLTSVIPTLEAAGLIRRMARVRERPSPEPKPELTVQLLDSAVQIPASAYRQQEAYQWLNQHLRMRPDRSLPLKSVLAAGRIDRRTIHALADRGAIELIEKHRDVRRSSMPRLNARPVQLTDEQGAAWREITRSLSTGTSRFLLHGVTGSGKTEVYFRCIADVLSKGRSAMLLVPEIGLAGQLIQRARGRFGERAILIHSALDDQTRRSNWDRAAAGEPCLIVGPRSALFAPVPDIGLIVVDEEHDAAYKQDQPSRYHARAVAQKLADLHDAGLILGSATPDVETRFRASESGWRLIELHERIGGRVADQHGQVRPHPVPLPEVEIVDMRSELRAGVTGLFSRQLEQRIQQRLARKEQTILFLNRRGMSTIVQCRSCGWVSDCPYCDVPMVYHRTISRLVCHRCGHRARPPQRCPECHSERIGYFGAGTQRVETAISAIVPEARLLRWDQDALRGGVQAEDLLAEIQFGDVDIVIGTQMVSKGLDLPNVTLVGVVNADTYLHLPDFRSAERTFQMLAQVAGRAGRRAAGGEVVIQTYSPNHYSIQAAAKHDYEMFYTEEIAFRRTHGYPPYKRLARLQIRHAKEDVARRRAEELADALTMHLIANPQYTGIDLLGPAPAFAARLRGQYGWQILVRGDQGPAALADFNVPYGWSVDIDPVSLL